MRRVDPSNPQSDTKAWPIVRRLLRYFQPYRAGIALALVLMALQSSIPGLLVILIQRVLDDVLIQRNTALLAVMPLAVIGLYGLNGALTFSRGMVTRTIAWRVVTELRKELFAAYLRQDVAWHQSQPTGEKLARLTNDVNNIQYGVSGIVTAIERPLTLVVLIGAAFYLNAKLAIIAVIALPLVAIPIDRFGRLLRTSARSALDNLANLSASSTETLAGIRVVKAFGGENERLARFESENEAQFRLQLSAFKAQLLPGPAIELIAAVGVGAVIWIGGQQVFSGEIEPGALIAFMVALGLLNDPLKNLAKIQSLTQRAVAGAEAAFAVMDRTSAVPNEGNHMLSASEVTVEFEAVAFAYERDEPAVLTDFSVTIPAGKTVALVGASGAGKTTAAALLSRFYDPSAGRITVNGIDLRELDLASLRQQVAVVSQDTFLFDDTVLENIRFGCPNASRTAVERAAKTANADAFIESLPKGYDTEINELGQRLSGGQRQRICIARAVLRDAPILVLDEATSALDAESEAAVQAALNALMQQRTVLAIAHRLSTIQSADEILVLDKGHVVERGVHGDLMQLGGVYARLVSRQTDWTGASR